MANPVTLSEDLDVHAESSATDLQSAEHVDGCNVSPSTSSGENPSHAVDTCAKILIVDDEPVNVKVLRKYLRDAGYIHFQTTSDASAAFTLIRDEKPDAVLLDYKMPKVNGLQILQTLRSVPTLNHIPVLILTASSDANIKHTALDLGATDFIAKPVDPIELIARIRNALLVKAHRDHLLEYSLRLESEIQARNRELIQSRMEFVHCLARAAEYRDGDTGYHVIRVGMYAGIIARQLGFPDKRVQELELAAQLHDVGKVGLADAVLRDEPQFDNADIAVAIKHCTIGKNIIRPMPDHRERGLGNEPADADNHGASCSPILEMAARIALTHHENWDGTGYPLGLTGEEIPIEGRIAAVADAFDTLASQPALRRDKCFATLEEGRQKQFDPNVLDAFQAGVRDIVQVQIQFADVE